MSDRNGKWPCRMLRGLSGGVLAVLVAAAGSCDGVLSGPEGQSSLETFASGLCKRHPERCRDAGATGWPDAVGATMDTSGPGPDATLIVDSKLGVDSKLADDKGPPVCPPTLQGAIDTTSTGGVLDLTGCSYTGAATVSRPMSIVGGTIFLPSGQAALKITSPDVVIDGITINGKGNTGSYSSGIWATAAHGLIVRNCTITDFVYGGIMVWQTHGGLIWNNHIARISGHPDNRNGYGIAFTDNTGGVDPTRDMTADGNVIEDIPTWQGINTHSGLRLTWTNNITRRVRRAYFLAPVTGARVVDCILKGNHAEAPGTAIVGGAQGYLVNNCDGCTFDGNFLSTGYPDAAIPDGGEWKAHIRDYQLGSTDLVRMDTTIVP